MEKYSKYKDSGVKWIGDVPAHWRITSFNRNFTYGKGLPITKADLLPEGIAVISYGQIHSKCNTGTSITDELVCRVSPSYLESNPQSLLRQNDFVFADTSEDIEGSGNCAFNDYREAIFAGYHTVIARPINLAMPKYYAYLFRSSQWRSSIQTLVNGVKVYSISKGILKRSFLLSPPLAEQRAIVSYLDGKLGQIDTYIAKQTQQIELLKELKQAVIANAVTKGIGKNSRKPSGVSWLGDVPDHWKLRKIKYVFAERSEKGYPEEPVLCSTQKYGVIPQHMYESRVVVVNKGLEGLKLVRKGDFVISLRSFQGGIEYAHYQGIISAAYTILKLNDGFDAEYMKYLMKSYNFIQLFQTCVTGIREGQNINYSLLKKNLLPIPPLPEQRAIVSYIEAQTANIDKLIDAYEQQVERIKEYKQRLISDAVTGKINVTDEQTQTN